MHVWFSIDLPALTKNFDFSVKLFPSPYCILSRFPHLHLYDIRNISIIMNIYPHNSVSLLNSSVNKFLYVHNIVQQVMWKLVLCKWLSNISMMIFFSLILTLKLSYPGLLYAITNDDSESEKVFDEIFTLEVETDHSHIRPFIGEWEGVGRRVMNYLNAFKLKFVPLQFMPCQQQHR